MNKKISIILVNYNGSDILPTCLDSLNKFINKDKCEIIIVDNASEDLSPEFVEENFPHIQLIRLPTNLGFGSGNNAGTKIAKGEFLFFLNTDTIITSNILPHLINLMERNPEVGIIGPKLLFPNGNFQISISPQISIQGEIEAKKLHSYAQSQTQLNILEQDFQHNQEVDIVVGAALFIRADLFNSLGGFDENFFMYFEESDLCKRAKEQGYKVLYTPEVSLIHVRGHSVSKVANKMAVEYRRSQLYYYKKHRPLWERLMLRIYLFSKFIYEFVTTSNLYSWKIIKLVFVYK
ncbi:MAG: glycosyltransferase family 2 protein [Sphaerospermopsis sp. SIO1G1]|nr:glycosyltransferase family 2 protein [Sphaerospermopsis sp. SIO1G1]